MRVRTLVSPGLYQLKLNPPVTVLPLIVKICIIAERVQNISAKYMYRNPHSTVVTGCESVIGELEDGVDECV